MNAEDPAVQADVDALASVQAGPEVIDRLADMGMPPGAFATFLNLEPERRALVLRLLNDPSEADMDELDSLDDGGSLARWLLTLPAYQSTPQDEDG